MRRMDTSVAQLGAAFSPKYDGSDPDWGGGSGPGSDPYWNLPYRAFLESFLRLNNIGSVVDVGCGDWQFSRHLDLRGIDYLGLDVVESVVQRNAARFGSDKVRFARMPDDLDAVPGAHLLIIKDVLQHLPIADILAFRERLFPRFNFCLVTNSFAKVHPDAVEVPRNTEVEAGGFRCLDLRAAPFDFPGSYVLAFPAGLNEELRTLLMMH